MSDNLKTLLSNSRKAIGGRAFRFQSRRRKLRIHHPQFQEIHPSIDHRAANQLCRIALTYTEAVFDGVKLPTSVTDLDTYRQF